jgi:hypothetical protein
MPGAGEIGEAHIDELDLLVDCEVQDRFGVHECGDPPGNYRV